MRKGKDLRAKSLFCSGEGNFARGEPRGPPLYTAASSASRNIPATSKPV